MYMYFCTKYLISKNLWHIKPANYHIACQCCEPENEALPWSHHPESTVSSCGGALGVPGSRASRMEG